MYHSNKISDDEKVALYGLCLDEFTVLNNKHYDLLVEYTNISKGLFETLKKANNKTIEDAIKSGDKVIADFAILGEYIYDTSRLFTMWEWLDENNEKFREETIKNMTDFVRRIKHLYERYLLG